MFSFGRWKKDKAGDFNEEKLLKKEMSFDFLKGGGKIEKIAKMSPVEYAMLCINLNIEHPYLIIEWSRRISRMVGLASGPRCGTNGLGQYKTHGIG